MWDDVEQEGAAAGMAQACAALGDGPVLVVGGGAALPPSVAVVCDLPVAYRHIEQPPQVACLWGFYKACQLDKPRYRGAVLHFDFRFHINRLSGTPYSFGFVKPHVASYSFLNSSTPSTMPCATFLL